MTYDVTPRPVFPVTFQDANLTLRAMAGVALYIGSALESLHNLPERTTAWDWKAVSYSAAEAECQMCEALQKLARSERPPLYPVNR